MSWQTIQKTLSTVNLKSIILSYKSLVQQHKITSRHVQETKEIMSQCKLSSEKSKLQWNHDMELLCSQLQSALMAIMGEISDGEEEQEEEQEEKPQNLLVTMENFETNAHKLALNLLKQNEDNKHTPRKETKSKLSSSSAQSTKLSRPHTSSGVDSEKKKNLLKVQSLKRNNNDRISVRSTSSYSENKNHDYLLRSSYTNGISVSATKKTPMNRTANSSKPKINKIANMRSSNSNSNSVTKKIPK